MITQKEPNAVQVIYTVIYTQKHVICKSKTLKMHRNNTFDPHTTVDRFTYTEYSLLT